jgi:hypothetical protein
MIVDNVWKLTNTVRVGLDTRSSHTERQSSFPDNVKMVKRNDKTKRLMIMEPTWSRDGTV